MFVLPESKPVSSVSRSSLAGLVSVATVGFLLYTLWCVALPVSSVVTPSLLFAEETYPEDPPVDSSEEEEWWWWEEEMQDPPSDAPPEEEIEVYIDEVLDGESGGAGTDPGTDSGSGEPGAEPTDCSGGSVP